MTFSGTALTLANDASISGLTVGKGGGSQSFNTALGYQSLNSASNGNNGQVGVGYQALYSNTTGSGIAVGYRSLYANTSGSNNTAIGESTLTANTTGGRNVGIGDLALTANTTASNNTAVGYQAGYSVSTNGSNTFIGLQAGYNATGDGNCLVGFKAGVNLTSGNLNCFVGQQTASGSSGSLVTTGTKNTILGGYNGNQGSLDIRTASNYIVLSDGDGNPRGIFDGSGNFIIGKAAIGITTVGQQFLPNGTASFTMAASTSAASTFDLYSTGASAYRFYVTLDGKIYCTSTTIAGISDQRLKENVRDLDVGLNAIMAVKPRRFDWKEGKGQDKKNAVGFIAQEFETVFPDSINIAKAGEDGIEYKTVCHEELIPAMVKAIQELKAEVDSLKQQLGK
jgi:hypothetical protein